MAKKGKTRTRDGKVWYWCTKGHNYNGKMVDMYETHLEVDHEFWEKYNKATCEEKKTLMHEKNERKRKFHTENNTGDDDNPKSKRMVMDSKMKEAFCTQSGMYESQVEAILKSCDPK